MHLFVLACALLLGVTGLKAQEGPPPPPPFWETSLGAGLAITSGNNDTNNFNLSFNTVYDPKTIHLFKADTLYLRGETEGERSADRAAALVRYERLASERIFYFAETSYLRDPFKDIDYLISPLAGAGYHVIKTDTRRLTFDGSAGYSFESGDAGGNTDGVAVKAGESFEWAISPKSKFTQGFFVLGKLEDLSEALYHFDAGLTTSIATRVELKLSYLYDYRAETPSPEIEKGDSALFAAILFKF